MSDKKPVTEIPYRGERIVQVEYNVPSMGNLDSWGFAIPKVFVVRDDMDEPCLPIVQQWFWSPLDAIAAIEARDTIAPERIGKKWPSTVQYEYNTMLVYRASFQCVYAALQKIRKTINEAKDFDENPGPEIERILHTLHQSVYQTAQGRKVPA